MTKVVYKNNEEIDKAIEVIDKFKKINNDNFRFEIHLDYEIDDIGHYEIGRKIVINPSLISKPFFDYGFPLSLQTNLTTLVLHEFGHYLDERHKIEIKYLKYCEEFGRLAITPYTQEEPLLCEEVAEIIQLYLTNPFILKTVDKKRYNWFRKFFKSPTPCTNKRFIKYWMLWNKQTKDECWNSYGISYDYRTMLIHESPALYYNKRLKQVERDCRRRVREWKQVQQ